MALTQNGIAQGQITGWIANLSLAEGLRGVLVDMGEIRGLGQRPEGGPWRAGLRNPDGEDFPGCVLLAAGRVLATWAVGAKLLYPACKVGHIFDPRTKIPQ